MHSASDCAIALGWSGAANGWSRCSHCHDSQNSLDSLHLDLLHLNSFGSTSSHAQLLSHAFLKNSRPGTLGVEDAYGGARAKIHPQAAEARCLELGSCNYLGTTSQKRPFEVVGFKA
jgi:hypothetical protein